MRGTHVDHDARRVEGVSGKELGALADQMRSGLSTGAVVVMTEDNGKATVAATVTPDLAERVSAVSLVQAAVDRFGRIDALVNDAGVDHLGKVDEGDFADQLRPMLATGSYGQPGDVANAVAFLARPDTGYITGSTLNVDGGFTI